MNERLKEDFPIEWEDDHFVTRREFFRFLTLASGGVTAGTVALSVFASIPKGKINFEPALICNADDLKDGTALAFSYPRPSDLCILVRRKDGEFVAFGRRCTHLSCPVEYEIRDERELLYCPCHNGAFSVQDGSVVQGPPPHPMPQVTLERRGNEIWATGIHKGKHA